MKVMQVVSLAGAATAFAGPQGVMGMSQSQYAGRKGSVQFMLLPQDAFVEYDNDDE